MRTESIQECLKEIVGQINTDCGAEIIEREIMPDRIQQYQKWYVKCAALERKHILL
jgi:hypothetical protein